MKKINTLILAVIAVFAFAAALMAQADLKIPAEIFDFGIMPQNAKVTGGYWLISSGYDTLRISDVKPGCGCTKAPLKTNTLAPGDSTFLEISFSSKQYKGNVRKGIRINSNASETVRNISLSGTVQIQMDSTKPVIVRPYKLDISQFNAKPREQMKFTLENVSGRDLEWNMVYFPGDYFEVKLPDKIKAGKSVEGILKIKPEYANTEFEKSFTIEFNDADKTRFTIPVTRSIRNISATDGGK
jgi:hypothetical protein